MCEPQSYNAVPNFEPEHPGSLSRWAFQGGMGSHPATRWETSRTWEKPTGNGFTIGDMEQYYPTVGLVLCH